MRNVLSQLISVVALYVYITFSQTLDICLQNAQKEYFENLVVINDSCVLYAYTKIDYKP